MSQAVEIHLTKKEWMILNGKERAAKRSCEYVEPGMSVGLGTGSTAEFMIRFLSEREKEEHLGVTCVATSRRSEELAVNLGLKVVGFHEVDKLDLTIDGADEIDYSLCGIKGGGGSLLYEKLVASASKKVIWIADETKMVDRIGKFPLPIEIVPFYHDKLFQKLINEGYKPTYRMDGDRIFTTDGGNHIFDLHLDEISDPLALHEKLKLMTGVIETGLFLDLTDMVIVGGENQERVIEKR